MNRLAALGAALAVSALHAADLSVPNTYTHSSPYKLTGDTTCDALKLAEGAALDLNGHNLTITAGSESNAALVTNSVDGTTAKISFTPTSNNGWGEQFQKLVFGGNLELTVCGIVNSGNTWAQKGFQGAVNTHTGGTVLDGYGVNSSEDGIYLPRINNTTFCGSGPLTLKNGATLMFTGSDNTTFEFPKIIFDGGTEERPNWFKSDRTITITSPIESAKASDVLHLTVDPGKNLLLQGDISGVKGVIRTKPKGNGTIQFQQTTGGMPDGTLRLFLHDANTSASVRYSGTGTEFALGGLETDPSITEPNANARIQKTVDSDNVTLKVGSANLDNDFYGKIQRDSVTKDWNVEKVGTGTWTLWGNSHDYAGPTTLTEGTLKLGGEGGVSANSTIVFNGGRLGFAASSSNTVANAIRATDYPITVDADEGACGVISSSTIGATAGLVKTGAGMVRLTGTKLVQNEGTSGKLMIASGNTGIGEVTTWEGGLGADELMLDAGQTLDLDGRDLMVRKVSQSSTVYGGSVVKNSSDTLATFTVGVGDGANANKIFALQGNVRYVVTGSDRTYFRDTTNKGPDGETVVANTHMGGTVISNTTNQLRFYDPGNFGTGPIVLHNASLMRPSSNLGDLNFSNPWEFYGTNSMELQHYAGNGASINLKGPWSGDGFIHIHNGFVPGIELNGDMADFEGTLEIAYKDGSNGFWMRGDNTNGLPKATLRLANVSGATGDARKTFLRIKPGNNATVEHPSTITAFPIGHLVTDGDDPDDYANAYIMDCQQWANCEWEIGGLNESGTFAGWFTEEAPANSSLAIKKVGTGTWTWTSSLHAFKGNLTVAEGRMDIDSANLTNCAIVVKSGATLGGTGTLSDKASVTVEAGGILAGSLTFGAGVTFESGAVFSVDEAATITGDADVSGTVVEVANPTALDTSRDYVFLTVEGAATGKPTPSAAIQALATGKGRWGVVSSTSNGVTTYCLRWLKSGFVISVF